MARHETNHKTQAKSAKGHRKTRSSHTSARISSTRHPPLDIDPNVFVNRLVEEVRGALRGNLAGSTAPRRPDDWLAFAVDLLQEVALSKYNDQKDKRALEEATLAKWLSCEERCAATNMRLEHGARVMASDWTARGILHEASILIANLIGQSPRLDDMLESGDFGPGATAHLRRRDANPYVKLAHSFEVTPGAAGFVADFIRGTRLEPYAIHACGLTLCYASRFTTVPKSSKINRPITIEPNWNMFLQKGYGSLLRRRLREVGVDLNDQTHNNRLARLASRGEDHATLDLSSASDLMSYGLVKFLLPSGWFACLEHARTPFVELDGRRRHKLEKFSAMGNGYTFELESLVFWAILTATVRLHTRTRYNLLGVYGDDLIAPTQCVQDLVGALEYAGFLVNHEKSHFDGPYHESCGKHYYRDADVTPFYIRRPVTNLEQLLLLHNNTVRWLRRLGFTPAETFSFEAVKALREAALSRMLVPCLIPDGYGDGGLLTPFDVAVPSLAADFINRKGKHPYSGWEGYLATVRGRVLDTQEAPQGEALDLWLFYGRSPRRRYYDSDAVITSSHSKEKGYRYYSIVVHRWEV